MAMPSGSELLLIFGVVVLLFGSKKIPELAKGIGQGIRSFKKETREEESPPPTAKSEAPKSVEAPSVNVSSAVSEDVLKHHPQGA